MTPDEIAKGLTKAQRVLVLASEGGAFGYPNRAYGTPVEGAKHRTALTLDRLGLGVYAYSDCFESLYFNNETGLAVRAILEAQQNDRPDI